MNLTKKSTVYFDPGIHNRLKKKAGEMSTSISAVIDKIVRNELVEDFEDLKAFADRVAEPTISYEKLVSELKQNGKL
ncbi:MAG: CopG family transcriptional regulator [bacterium]